LASSRRINCWIEIHSTPAANIPKVIVRALNLPSSVPATCVGSIPEPARAFGVPNQRHGRDQQCRLGVRPKLLGRGRMVKIFELAATQYDRREHEEQQMGTTLGLRDWLRQPGAVVAE
jgi:hypothetical protein